MIEYNWFRINNLFGSDSEDDNLVVDDARRTIAEEESSAPEVTKIIPSIPLHFTLPNNESGEQEKYVKTVIMTEEGPAAEIVFSPPCIRIAEEKGQSPIEIRLSIKGNILFKNLLLM